MVAMILMLTLSPQPVGELTPIEHMCLVCGPIGLADVLANIVLFTPLGAALVLAGMSRRAAILCCVALSMGIELMQLVVIAGRWATVSDVITNSIGGIIGASTMAARGALLRPSRTAALRLTLGAACGWLVVLSFGGWAFSRPVAADASSVRSSNYAYAPGFGWFEGMVSEATLDDRTISHRGTGPVVLRGDIGRAVRARVSASGRDHRNDEIALLFLHSALDTFPVLLLSQRRSQAAFSIGTRGVRARLRRPCVSIHGVLGPQATNGSPYTIDGEVRGDSMIVTFDRDSEHYRNAVRLSPTLSWALLSPIPQMDAQIAPLATIAWIVGLVLPLGYWATIASRGVRRARAAPAGAIAVTAIIVGLSTVPHIWGFGTADIGEWSAAAAGLALGTVAAALFSNAPRPA